MDLLLMVIAISVVILGIVYVALYYLNQSVDQIGR